ncbi:hypothetical protein ROZALSC1DRAFT_27804 [Rozella allomycis CSF55]|uniref:RING-type E3 ubiquitin transferase n=1 Tax=Rozella allomycis (strain CSF55) TaxID=988480 RepID=A0A075B2F1_ROZAC|nr:Zinc finger, RING-type domain-containing protein [Rozella allomycis CSF55]RKP20730.1 hypothetical protein ROZALSC1DRAFT_27804 [Rozella allomycis CSF55]|eukprot:EPZ36770.1 Zinc finger, RING-type domain-containing protein [Rozella allomycis CSF55]
MPDEPAEQRHTYSYTSDELRNRNVTTTERVSSPERRQPEENTSEKDRDSIVFECNICFDTASKPVVSLCGHLYCWPCISRWINRNQTPLCPVCKAGIGKDKLIPVYCRGNEKKDPRDEDFEEPMPQGQRPEPQINEQFNRRRMPFEYSFSFGVFPFGMFNMNAFTATNQPQHHTEDEDEQRRNELSKFVLVSVTLFLLMTIFS